jgi:hypothetical protein
MHFSTTFIQYSAVSIWVIHTLLQKISDSIRVWHMNPWIDKQWTYCLVSVSCTGTYKAATWLVWAVRAGTTWTVNIQLPSAPRNGCHSTKTWGMLCMILAFAVLWLRFPFFWDMVPHHWVIGSWHLLKWHHVPEEQKPWAMFFQSLPDRLSCGFHVCCSVSA